MNQIETDTAMIKMAITWGMNSKAKRFKVGALIVKNKQIISDGFNGTPSGFDNVCEIIDDFAEDVLKTKDIVLHAESNAISKLAKNGGIGSHQATLYTTVGPCINCAKQIIQAGIERVVYAINYRDQSGIELLLEAGIEVTWLPEFEDFYDNLLTYSK